VTLPPGTVGILSDRDDGEVREKAHHTRFEHGQSREQDALQAQIWVNLVGSRNLYANTEQKHCLRLQQRSNAPFEAGLLQQAATQYSCMDGNRQWLKLSTHVWKALARQSRLHVLERYKVARVGEQRTEKIHMYISGNHTTFSRCGVLRFGAGDFVKTLCGVALTDVFSDVAESGSSYHISSTLTVT
jgi:hypothetical protein